MDICTRCGMQYDIPEYGYLILSIADKNILNTLKPFAQSFNANHLFFQYASHDDLIAKTNSLVSQMHEHAHQIKVGVTSTKENPPFPSGSLLEFQTRIENYDLIQFIQTGPIKSFFQPIINIKTNSVYAYEHLLRADSSEHAYSPGQMFSVAQRAGMQGTLDQRARKEAIMARATHLNPSIKSFINFLPSSIYNPKFCLKHTFEFVKKYNVPPSSLVFEVVETEKITNIDHLKTILEEYKANGMEVALDDVGSGFATLDMLYKLKPNYVKIDRKYVQNCHVNHVNQQFLTSVLEIASELHIKVLAEGIEQKEELEFCRSIGIDFAQGYYLGKPNATPAKLRQKIV